jgi:arsenate reductase
MRTVLFVCEFNACRSQLGEGVAQTILPSDWRILSAGLTATGVDREVIRALGELRVDCRSLTSKSLHDVRALAIDDVFVLAEPANAAVRSTFPNSRIWEWPIDDPLRVAGGRAHVEAAVRQTRDEIRRRLAAWLAEQQSAA